MGKHPLVQPAQEFTRGRADGEIREEARAMESKNSQSSPPPSIKYKRDKVSDIV